MSRLMENNFKPVMIVMVMHGAVQGRIKIYEEQFETILWYNH